LFKRGKIEANFLTAFLIGLTDFPEFFIIGLTSLGKYDMLEKRRALLSLPSGKLARIEMLFQKVVKSGQVTQQAILTIAQKRNFVKVGFCLKGEGGV
jgi:hypothetical protein